MIVLVLKSHERASISHAMSFTLRLPDDPSDHQQFLDDLLRSNDELRQQAEAAQQQAEDAQGAGRRSSNECWIGPRRTTINSRKNTTS